MSIALSFLTPAELLSRGLALPPVEELPESLPPGTACSITGQPISVGYRVGDMTTDATAEFLDCFKGGVHGHVSESAARCFRSANPRAGNPCARSHLVFEDGTYYGPLISAEAEETAVKALVKARSSLEALGPDTTPDPERDAALKAVRVAEERAATVGARPVWSRLVREVWPERSGQQCLAVLTTDTKKRLWPRARVGALGHRTPVFVHDAELSITGTVFVNWERLLSCLDALEEVYSLGFPKTAIGQSLYRATKAMHEVGVARARSLEHGLAAWRDRPEFPVALLIAQRSSAASAPAPRETP